MKKFLLALALVFGLAASVQAQSQGRQLVSYTSGLPATIANGADGVLTNITVNIPNPSVDIGVFYSFTPSGATNDAEVYLSFAVSADGSNFSTTTTSENFPLVLAITNDVPSGANVAFGRLAKADLTGIRAIKLVEVLNSTGVTLTNTSVKFLLESAR